MFLNRWLFRHEVIEQNQLNSDEEKAVFAVLKSFQGDGARARFLESDVDAVIGWVRRGRPLETKPLSVHAEEDVQVTGQTMGDRNPWAASVERSDGRPSPKRTRPLLVDEKQAARMLGVSRRMVFELNKQGILPSVMVGARKKYSVKMLEAFANGGDARWQA